MKVNMHCFTYNINTYNINTCFRGKYVKLYIHFRILTVSFITLLDILFYFYLLLSTK